MTEPGQTLALPQAPYTPGRGERPAESWFEPIKEALPENASIKELAASAAFAAGLEAFRRGYYWEAHEFWEAVWMRLPPASAERRLLQGLIQLANGALKRRMDLAGAAARIFERAEAALTEAFRGGRAALMGLSRSDVARLEIAAADRRVSAI